MNDLINSVIKELPLDINEIILTAGKENAEALKKNGYNSIQVFDEIDKVSEDFISIIKNRCTVLYSCFDFSDVGVQLGKKLCSRFPFIINVELPISDYKKYSDSGTVKNYIELNGAAEFDELLDQAKYHIDFLRYKEEFKFWGVNSHKNPILLDSKVFLLLKKLGIYKYRSTNKSFSIIKITGRIVEFTTVDYIQDLLRSILIKYHKNEAGRLIAQIPKLINKKNLILLSEKRELNFHSGLKKSQLFLFENVSICIDQNQIRKTNLNSFNHYFKKNNFLNFYPTLHDDYFKITRVREKYDIEIINNSCDYLKFLRNVSSLFWRNDNKSTEDIYQETINLLAIITHLGYILHNYRDPSRLYMVILTDYQGLFTGKQEGGSGKSLFCSVLKEIANVVPFSGKNKNLFHKDSSFSRLNSDSQIALINDIYKGFKVEDSYNLITDDRIVRNLFEDDREISSNQSIKLVTTTNETVDLSHKSTDRRIRLLFLSDYYSEDRITPAQEFGYSFFTSEMPMEQKNMFFNIMFQSVKAYLRWGIIKAPTYSSEMKVLADKIGLDYIEWADGYLQDHDFNSRIKRTDFEGSFRSVLSENDNSRISTRQIKDKTKSYCKLRRYYFNPHKNGGDIKSNSIEYYQITRKEGEGNEKSE